MTLVIFDFQPGISIVVECNRQSLHIESHEYLESNNLIDGDGRLRSGSGEQIIGLLHESKPGVSLKGPCRRSGFSKPGFYAWWNKFSGLEVTDVKRLKALGTENGRSKQRSTKLI